MSRKATIDRQTKETRIRGALDLDGAGRVNVKTGVGFLDHLLTALAFHAGFDLDLSCEGDLEIDDHHSAEDCGIALGESLRAAIGEPQGIRRFGSAYAPLDEALARTVIDISGRPFAAIDLGLRRESLGALACENVGHVLQSLAMSARITLHVDVLKGDNDHHRAEAAFKATALALRKAVARTDSGAVPSTKGSL